MVLAAVSFNALIRSALSISSGVDVLLSAAVLVLLSAYDVLGAAERDAARLRFVLLVAIVPLVLLFAVVLLARSLVAY